MVDIGVVAGAHVLSCDVHSALDARKDGSAARVQGPIEVRCLLVVWGEGREIAEEIGERGRDHRPCELRNSGGENDFPTYLTVRASISAFQVGSKKYLKDQHQTPNPAQYQE